MVSLLSDAATVDWTVAIVVEADALEFVPEGFVEDVEDGVVVAEEIDDIVESSIVNVESLDAEDDVHDASTDANTSTVTTRRRDDFVFVIGSFG